MYKRMYNNVFDGKQTKAGSYSPNIPRSAVRTFYARYFLSMGLITAMARDLLLCVKDGDDSGCGSVGEVGSQLNGLCEKNGEGSVLPEPERVERGGCVLTELAVHAEYLALPTASGQGTRRLVQEILMFKWVSLWDRQKVSRE
jgi:hypothetical protein